MGDVIDFLINFRILSSSKLQNKFLALPTPSHPFLSHPGATGGRKTNPAFSCPSLETVSFSSSLLQASSAALPPPAAVASGLQPLVLLWTGTWATK